MNVLSIAAELRARAAELGWFVLEMHDPIEGAVTRLGFFDAASHQHRDITIARARTRDAGEGWIFAETYERDRVLGGRVDASIVINHATADVYVEGIEGHQKDLLRTSIEAVGSYDPKPCAQAVSVTWRDDDEAYKTKIHRAIESLAEVPDGVICLTTGASVEAEQAVDSLAVYASLRSSSNAPRAGVIAHADTALVSASPETFVTVHGCTLRTDPMKGTRRRGATPEEDAWLKQDLETSEKELAENRTVARATRDEVQQVCVARSARITSECVVYSFEQVHQMVSEIEGEVRDGITVGEVLDATFPSASMTGAPKAWAIGVLETLESSPRGLYSGCYGWVSADGVDVQIAMAIRCAEVQNRTAFVGAGGGITRDSDAPSELAEVKLKARAVLEALGAGYS